MAESGQLNCRTRPTCPAQPRFVSGRSPPADIGRLLRSLGEVLRVSTTPQVFGCLPAAIRPPTRRLEHIATRLAQRVRRSQIAPRCTPVVELDSQQVICRHRSHQPKAARRVALFSYVGAKESVEHDQHATVVSIQIFIPYEFGVKVSITTTHKEGLVIGMRSMPGNPYDGHTLAEALEQASIVSEAKPEVAIVDRGYKGVAVDDVKIYHPGLRRGITRGLRAMIRRRSAIGPAIGHMKTDGKLDRKWLKGALGDAMHAVLCGAGHNLRMILRKLRLLCAFILAALINRSIAVTPSP